MHEEIEGHRKRLESEQKKHKDAADKEKLEKNRTPETGASRKYDSSGFKAVAKKIKELLSKAKKSELVNLFNAVATSTCTSQNHTTQPRSQGFSSSRA